MCVSLERFLLTSWLLGFIANKQNHNWNDYINAESHFSSRKYKLFFSQQFTGHLVVPRFSIISSKDSKKHQGSFPDSIILFLIASSNLFTGSNWESDVQDKKYL